MLKHSELAEIAARSYSGPQSGIAAGDVREDLVPRGDELVIAIPGTHADDALDWLRDFSAWPISIEGIGLVHGGFGTGARAVYPRIAHSIEHDSRDLYTFTGHSLGGAIAQILAAIHIFAVPTAQVRVVTFGAPRVAWLNPRLPWLLRRRCVEDVAYDRRGDIVPKVPSRALGYHSGVFWPPRIGRPTLGVVENHDISQYRADLIALGL